MTCQVVRRRHDYLATPYIVYDDTGNRKEVFGNGLAVSEIKSESEIVQIKLGCPPSQSIVNSDAILRL